MREDRQTDIHSDTVTATLRTPTPRITPGYIDRSSKVNLQYLISDLQSAVSCRHAAFKYLVNHYASLQHTAQCINDKVTARRSFKKLSLVGQELCNRIYYL